MTKATILASLLVLVLVAATLSVWLAGDHSTVLTPDSAAELSDRGESSAVEGIDDTASSLGDAQSPGTDRVVSQIASADGDLAGLPMRDFAFPLVGEPEQIDNEYADARDLVSAMVGQGLAATQIRVVEVHQEHVVNLFEFARSEPARANGQFTIPLFAGIDCTLVDVTRAISIEERYWNFSARCEEIDSSSVTGSWVNDTGRVTFNIQLRPTSGRPIGAIYVLSPLDGNRFSYVAETDVATAQSRVFSRRP